MDTKLRKFSEAVEGK